MKNLQSVLGRWATLASNKKMERAGAKTIKNQVGAYI